MNTPTDIMEQIESLMDLIPHFRMQNDLLERMKQIMVAIRRHPELRTESCRAALALVGVMAHEYRVPVLEANSDHIIRECFGAH